LVADFEDAVRSALESLPAELADKLENVAVVIEDEDPRNPHLLGLFESAPLMPRKITIFRRPLEEDFGHDRVELERQIRITVLHELAHYFGLDEERLAELGYG
jgi:predicted Zn-dependent protease with MMP-like domain